MFKQVFGTVLAATTLGLLAHTSYGIDLWQVYQKAKTNAPVLQNYAATKDAAFDGYYSQRGSLLPSVALTGIASVNQIDTSLYSDTYEQANAVIGLTQQVINLNTWGSTLAARRSAYAADATYQDDLANFTLMIAKDYFAILDDHDTILSDEAAVSFYQQTLQQTQQQYQAGLSTSSDVKQAEANLDTGKATLISDQNILQTHIAELAKYTHQSDNDLSVLKKSFPFVMPTPKTAQAWVDQARKGNYSLQAARLTADSSRAGVAAAIGNQLPQVNFVANYGGTRTFADNQHLAEMATTRFQRDWSVALQLSWNIFSGGANFASSAQAVHQYESADADSTETYRSVMSQTQQDFRAVESDIARVEALKQAVLADNFALKQLQAKYKVGTETIKNVLDQARKLYADRKTYATAQYTYITDYLTLENDAGSLTPSSIKAINKWLIPAPKKS